MHELEHIKRGDWLMQTRRAQRLRRATGSTRWCGPRGGGLSSRGGAVLRRCGRHQRGADRLRGTARVAGAAHVGDAGAADARHGEPQRSVDARHRGARRSAAARPRRLHAGGRHGGRRGARGADRRAGARGRTAGRRRDRVRREEQRSPASAAVGQRKPRALDRELYEAAEARRSRTASRRCSRPAPTPNAAIRRRRQPADRRRAIGRLPIASCLLDQGADPNCRSKAMAAR